MIYGITAFAGYEAAAALGEEARNARRSIPASTIGIVVATGLFYLVVVCAEAWGVGRDGIAGFWRHLLIPACAAVLLLFPLWGILHPRAHTLMDLLPFTALGWLCVGVIVAAVLRARRPVAFETRGRVFTPPVPGGADRLSVGAEPPPVREKELE